MEKETLTKQVYEKPEMEIVYFETEDIITASGTFSLRLKDDDFTRE